MSKIVQDLPMEWSAPADFVYARKAARRKIEDRSSALPTTPVTLNEKTKPC